MLKENEIRRADQTFISYDDFQKELSLDSESGADIAVGSDSQVLPNHISFVTTICVHYPGRGGKFFFVKNREASRLFPNMRLRIMNEVFLSIEAANDIEEIISKKVEVHVDIGSEERVSKTSRFCKEFIGIVNSSGFVCKIKPDSWASYVADKFTKS
jgi:predicted RNase H-related nuclease YkuK (DUF458 family)